MDTLHAIQWQVFLTVGLPLLIAAIVVNIMIRRSRRKP